MYDLYTYGEQELGDLFHLVYILDYGHLFC
uniref:Uncharacterized protein n=1 Tax=Nymphaea colorata TaxID=210225 RepID=A0A5K1CC45_9MAGN